MTYYRRRLLRPHVDALRAALAECRADLAALSFRHQCKLADLHRELDAVRAELDQARALYDQLRSVSLARAQAHGELVALHRERDIERAQAAERDLAQPLQ